MHRVEQPERIWPQLWSLADAADADAESAARDAGGRPPPPRPSSGAALWRVAAQQPGGAAAAAAAGGGEAGSSAVGGRGGALDNQLADAALALWHERFLSEGAHLPAEDEALDDGADEYDWGMDEDFPGATG